MTWTGVITGPRHVKALDIYLEWCGCHVLHFACTQRPLDALAAWELMGLLEEVA